nr:RecName: Full=Acid shock protein 1 [Fructilactobacillus sanfranciscensis]
SFKKGLFLGTILGGA